MILPYEDLHPGRMYLVGVRYNAGRAIGYIEREFRALFTGSGQYNELNFSFRPIGGLQAVPKEWITKLEEARNKPPFLPRQPETR